DQKRYAWTADRELRRSSEYRAPDQRRVWHVPDAVITLDQRQEVALEVELTQKTDQRLTETVARLTQQYKGVWYFVTDDVREAVVKAIGSRTQSFRVYRFAEVLTGKRLRPCSNAIAELVRRNQRRDHAAKENA